jgi:hypothetical protein
MRKYIPKSVRYWLRRLIDYIPFRLLRIKARPLYYENRFNYQKYHFDFNLAPGQKALDIGSGGEPFPYATFLLERHLNPTQHRYCDVVTNGKPLMVADIENLPFSDNCIDFIYCSHVLEHIDFPIKACEEIMRVGRRGYIETPTFGKDALFSWAKNMHKWYLVAVKNTLCFFEYSERQLGGIQSSAWRDIIFSKWHHPLQEAFFKNPEIFNVMFHWSDKFAVYVFYSDGKVESSEK